MRCKRLHQWICTVGGSLVVLLCLGTTEVWAQEVAVRNVQARQKGSNVVVTYTLTGEKDAVYEINLTVSANNGRSFGLEPKAVTADVGKGIRPGKQKKIKWDVLSDIPKGLQGEGYKFRVTARRQKVDPSTGGLRLGVIIGHAPPAKTPGAGVLLRYRMGKSPVRLGSSFHFYHYKFNFNDDFRGYILGCSLDLTLKLSLFQIGIGGRIDEFNIGDLSGGDAERGKTTVADAIIGITFEGNDYTFFLRSRVSTIGAPLNYNNLLELGMAF